jgi:hypothetical protein
MKPAFAFRKKSNLWILQPKTSMGSHTVRKSPKAQGPYSVTLHT